MSPKILCYLLVIAVFSLSGGQLINNLKGRHIRVATVHLPPLMTIQHGSRGVQYSGALFEHLEWLSRRLHFKYELVQEPNNTIGTEVNGSWNGLIDQLIQHEIDLALFPLTIYYQRHRVISFSGWFAGGRNVLLTPYPTAQFSAWAVAEPFSNQVWIGWLVSLTGVTAVSGALMSLERARSRNGCNNSTRTDSWFFYIFGTIMAQGGYWRTRYKFLRILAVTWCLGAFVFVNVYCTTLTSKLATCYNAPEINSIEQLAQSSTYNIAVIKGSTAETDIKSAVPEAFQLIRNKLVNCEQCTTHFVEELGRKVLQGDFIGFQVHHGNYPMNRSAD